MYAADVLHIYNKRKPDWCKSHAPIQLFRVKNVIESCQRLGVLRTPAAHHNYSFFIIHYSLFIRKDPSIRKGLFHHL